MEMVNLDIKGDIFLSDMSYKSKAVYALIILEALVMQYLKQLETLQFVLIFFFYLVENSEIRSNPKYNGKHPGIFQMF